MQEVEINPDYNHELLSFNGYSLLIDFNDVKSRIGIYGKNCINYVRRADLEQRYNGIMILDINVKSKYLKNQTYTTKRLFILFHLL